MQVVYYFTNISLSRGLALSLLKALHTIAGM